MQIIYNVDNIGLESFFKPWQVWLLKYMEQTYPNWIRCRDATQAIKETHNISRTSIMNFLKEMVENNIIEYTEKSSKGGYHGLYRLRHKGTQLKLRLVGHIIDILLKNFPQETKKAIETLQ